MLKNLINKFLSTSKPKETKQLDVINDNKKHLKQIDELAEYFKIKPAKTTFQAYYKYRVFFDYYFNINFQKHFYKEGLDKQRSKVYDFISEFYQSREYILILNPYHIYNEYKDSTFDTMIFSAIFILLMMIATYFYSIGYFVYYVLIKIFLLLVFVFIIYSDEKFPKISSFIEKYKITSFLKEEIILGINLDILLMICLFLCITNYLFGLPLTNKHKEIDKEIKRVQKQFKNKELFLLYFLNNHDDEKRLETDLKIINIAMRLIKFQEICKQINEKYDDKNIIHRRKLEEQFYKKLLLMRNTIIILRQNNSLTDPYILEKVIGTSTIHKIQKELIYSKI